MKKSFFTGILLSLVYAAHAQDFVDNALLFSRTQPGGSARILALGGAQVSLGGDYSSALSNPAGLGMYNRSELTFSLGFFDSQNKSTYLANTTNDGRATLNIPGFSYVQKQQHSKDKFLGGAFAIALNRTNNLNTRYSYQADNSQSSLIDYFIDYAWSNGLTAPVLEADYTLAGLAFYNYNYLFNVVDNNGTLEYGSPLSPLPADPANNIPAEVRTVTQREEVLRRGAQNQLSFSYGGNYDDVLFFGATLGVSTIRFRQEQTFSEFNYRFNQSPGYNPLDGFDATEDFDIQGSGVNFTVGAIVRPVNFVQLGFSVATPTFYNVTDSYTARIDSYWNNFDYNNNGEVVLNTEFAEFDVPLISDYNLTTPAKATAGISFISKYGFISGDFEFVNYGKAKYESNVAGESYSGENTSIKAAYTNVMNIRVGGEFRYELLRLRAGFAHQPDPFRVTNGVDRTVQSFTGGVGIRTSTFFIDAAVVQSTTNRLRSPYSPIDLPTPVATQKNANTNIVITAGFPF
jgi:hypothetical protein